MTRQPEINLPTVRVTDQLEVADPGACLLAELADAAPVRHVIMGPDPEGDDGPRALIHSVRLHCVYAPSGATLTRYDFKADRTSLAFMSGYPGGAVLAVAQPGEPYTWLLIGLLPIPGGLDDATDLPVTGLRPASPAEAAILDRVYPGWLEACRAFDGRAAAARQAEGDPLLLPPPPPLAG